MKTIGTLIKEARLKKHYSLKKVEAATKIKAEFIEKIESGNWKELPNFPVVIGFVKNIAALLKINLETAMALLRRDYPPHEDSLNPKQNVEDKFVWTPRLTFFAGVGLIVLMFLGYIFLQYSRFVSPPSLTVEAPKENQVITENKILVSGKTDTDATILINNQPALLDSDGNFSTTIEIDKNTSTIEVKASSRSGRETIIRRKIIPKL